MERDGWILDLAATGSGIGLWVKEGGRVRHRHAAFPPSFHLALPDPHAHWEMLEALDDRYGIEECSFRTVYGPVDGYRVHAGRKVAEAIERQTRASAQLYDVDVRREQRFFAAEGLFPCGHAGESRFSADFAVPLGVMEIRVGGDPRRDTAVSSVEVDAGEGTEVLRGSEPRVIADLAGLVAAHDPDVLLVSHADAWMHRIAAVADEKGISLSFSRSGEYRSLGSRSYWSYGRREFRPPALIPEGRLLIDTEASFMYREGGLSGVLLASRLTGISPNLTSRFTPGTLVSGYEVFEAVRRGIAVPFRKSDPERLRRCTELRTADRGGMMLQPDAGVYGPASQLDFTSLYPSIIVRYNLSPETLDDPGKSGFLAAVLAPLLDLRVGVKRRKKTDPSYAGIDSILKWMLVTCFGYTGYRNAKFGRIEMHERITAISREILLDSKAIAEEMGFSVLHGIVDCLWVQGPPVGALKRRIEDATGMLLECEAFDWIVFLPQADGSGAYNRYFGRLADGTVRVRGIAARRKDTPPYIVRMQQDLLAVAAEAGNPAGLAAREPRAAAVYRRYRDGLASADPADLAITRRISRTTYAQNCLEGSAVRELRRRGIDTAPGMEIAYVVRDAARWLADPAWDAGVCDRRFYLGLIERAWEEIAFAFRGPRRGRGLSPP
jgi:DNA polymerase I